MLIIIWRATGKRQGFSLIIVPPSQEENVSVSLQMAAMSSWRDHRPEARLVGNRVPPQRRLATHPLEQGVRRAVSEQIGIAQIDLGEIDGLFTGQRHCDTSQTSREMWRAYINAPQPMRGAARRENVGASLVAT